MDTNLHETYAKIFTNVKLQWYVRFPFHTGRLGKIAPIWSSVDTLLEKIQTIECKLSVLVQTSKLSLFLSDVYFGYAREGWLL